MILNLENTGKWEVFPLKSLSQGVSSIWDDVVHLSVNVIEEQ